MAKDDSRRDDRPMLIRFPEGSDLRQRLEERAAANRRTLTAEVLDLLEFVLDPRTVQLRDDSHETHSELLGQLAAFQRQAEPMIMRMWEKLKMGPVPDDVHPRNRKPANRKK